ncbi:alpha/beta hydrolase [Conexibacter sp. JD483]|uniref:alpha/beta fold hydrolase n=1 Tax=unclassified Conexibacter TaxID=2627773 RepID=UPI00271C727C|nr:MULTISPECIES: alpha/beta hydrolase [unclassified Conexibacter]MDO8186931.1 alpha/beta hydrolase [Conexibacter sp. CPCC 205706]MDO8200614.1 alpha/beta hydrolase [Conexibacter sp. CPCC 205762]MDR9368808.1 alpha/beta hydrolase [Conexibacter sp. JD483]
MNQRLIDTPSGQRIQIVEDGDPAGPLVLLLHGFPETSRSWRHQLPALAAAGCHAVAPDLRGYGGSGAPETVEDYRMLSLVADNVALVEALGAASAIVIGHDWGSPIAAASALLRPDLFTAVGLLSVPYTPPGGPRPTSVFAQMPGPEQFYVAYFQQPGVAEAEIEADPREWVRGFAAALAGGADAPAPGDDAAPSGPVFTIPPGGRMRDRFPAGAAADRALAGWLPDTELDALAASLTEHGATPALNRYRNMDRDWEDLAAWRGQPLRQPSLWLVGERDASAVWLADAIAAYPQTLPGLRGAHTLAGAGHWLQQERPAEVNALLTDWLRSL